MAFSAALQKLNAAHADALVSFLSDEKSVTICELVYEHFGIKKMVVYLNKRAHYDWFREFGVLVVEPRTAVVQLLEQFVRAPAGASILLGTHEGQQIADVVLRDPTLVGLTVRDLRLPLDVLILSTQRNQQTLVPHGYTKLEMGDILTMVGPEDILEEVIVGFDA